MFNLRLLRHSKCSVISVQRQMSFCALPKCVKQVNITNNFGTKMLAKPLVSAPMITRFSGSAAAVETDKKNYATLWRAERVVSIALMGLFPAAILYPSTVLDTLLAVSTSFHVYWGMEALVVDYLRPSVVGQLANKAGHAAITLLTVVTLAGFFQVIFMGDGLADALIKLWNL